VRKKTTRRTTEAPLRLEWVAAEELADNPRNWRRHPAGQVAALKELIGDPEIGWAGVLLFNERTGRLIDGHARKESVAPDTLVPVVIGSWSEAAERKILVTLDPLASMAQADADELRKLLDEVELDGEALAGVNETLRGLLVEEPGTGDGQIDSAAGQGQSAATEYRVVVDCANAAQQAELLKRFAAEGLTCRGLQSEAALR